MKRTAVATLVAGTIALAPGASVFAQDVAVETDEAKVSYGVGMMMGEQLKQFGDIDYDLLIAGLRAQKEGEETQITIEEAQAAIMAQQQEAAEAASAEASAASAQYLEENAAKEGVTVTDSGLQYEVLDRGRRAEAERRRHRQRALRRHPARRHRVRQLRSRAASRPSSR